MKHQLTITSDGSPAAPDMMRVRTRGGYEMREVACRPLISMMDGSTMAGQPEPMLKDGEGVAYYANGEVLVYRTGQSAP